MNILEEIAAKRRIDIEERKKRISLDEMKKQAQKLAEKEKVLTGKFFFSFKKQISRAGINFICEVKKAPPSKGLIAHKFPYLEIAKEYEKAGAAAISGKRCIFTGNCRGSFYSCFKKGFYGG